MGYTSNHAIWRRIKLVPFEVTITEAERDRRLLAKLQNELPGILAWAIQGCIEWQREGLGSPEKVSSATENYRSEMDVVGQFIVDCCVEHDSATSTAHDLYQAYLTWCDKNGQSPMKQSPWGSRLRDRGYHQVRFTGGRRGWKGIELVTNFS